LVSHFLENDFHLCIVMNGNNHSVLYLLNSGSNYWVGDKKGLLVSAGPRYTSAALWYLNEILCL